MHSAMLWGDRTHVASVPLELTVQRVPTGTQTSLPLTSLFLYMLVRRGSVLAR